MKVRKLNKLLYLIKPDIEQNTKTKSGVIVDTSTENRSYKTGQIVEAGIGRVTETGYTIYPSYYKDELVSFENRNTYTVMVDDEELIVVPEDNIIFSYTK